MPPPTFIDHLRRTEGHRGRAKLPHLTKTVRSGLSPIRRPERETRQTHHTDAIWAALTAENDIESQNHKAEESHQRWKFRGFTSLELEDLGALPTMSDENFKKPTLDNPIHPIFERKKWKEKDPWQPLGNGRPGNWVASNDLVWEAMQPSLRLATLFLTNFHIFPWYVNFLHLHAFPRCPQLVIKNGILSIINLQDRRRSPRAQNMDAIPTCCSSRTSRPFPPAQTRRTSRSQERSGNLQGSSAGIGEEGAVEI